MTTTINASNSGSGGLVQTADASGVLALQTAGVTAVTIDASQRTAFVAGTAALPAITTTGDTNTGIFFPAADTIAFSEGGAEAMRIDSSGNVGIGTSSPSYKLDITGSTARIYNDSAKLLLERPTNSRSGSISLTGSTGAIQYYAGNNGAGETSTVAHQFYSDSPSALSPLMTILGGGNVGIGTTSPRATFEVTNATNSGWGAIVEKTAGSGTPHGLFVSTGQNSSSNFLIKAAVGTFASSTDAFLVDGTGVLKFNSGYGSAATAYGCRAWVNFNGQSSAAIRGSGNISSITINGTGDWTLNFATAMPDGNYSAVFGSDSIGNNDARGALVEKSNDGTNYHLAGSLRIIYGYTFTSGLTSDGSFMSNVAIFR